MAQPQVRRGGGEALNGQGEALVAESLGSLSRVLQQVSYNFQVADAQRQKLDDQIQRGVILAQLGEDVTGGLQELHLTGLEPEQYEAEGARLIQRHVQAAQQQIRDPQGQQRFQLDAAQFTAKARTELKTEAYKAWIIARRDGGRMDGTVASQIAAGLYSLDGKPVVTLDASGAPNVHGEGIDPRLLAKRAG